MVIITIAPHGRTATNGGRPCGGIGIAGASPVSSKSNPVVRVGNGFSNESTKGCDTKAARAIIMANSIFFFKHGKTARASQERLGGGAHRRLSLGEQSRRSLTALLLR